jgi:hypothetical protein
MGCTLSEDKKITPEAASTAINDPVESVSDLDSSTGPYLDALSLLDGVCFEYLYTLGGQSWVWTSPDDLTAFYDRVDASERCGDPVVRATMDFSDQILVGAVQAGIGCDAAFQFVELAQDGNTQTVVLRYTLQTGCDYELAQPYLIAIPRPPEGITVRITIVAG